MNTTAQRSVVPPEGAAGDTESHPLATERAPEAPAPSPRGGRWMSIRALAAEYPEAITESALRHLVWQAEAQAKNPKAGLKANGFLPVIVRPPGQRKVLLDRAEWEKWLTSRRKTGTGSMK